MVATLSNKVHNGPVGFAALEEIKDQIGEFSTTQPAARLNGRKRCVALTITKR
jgi:hypothetical protein